MTLTAFPKADQVRRSRGKPKAEPATDSKPARTPRAAKPKPESPALTVVEAPEKAPLDLTVRDLPLTAIVHGRNPRLEATPTEIKDLTSSVRQHGVLQPIRVRPVGDAFQIIAGHRRYEAALAAKLKTIPVVIGIVPDDSVAYTQSLVENLQRQDLNPLDEARAFQILLDEQPQTQEDLGKKIGRSQSYIANALRLLGLEEPVKEALVSGKLTVAHAKAMASLPPERQKDLVTRVVDEKMTSRDVEDRIRREKEQATFADQAKKRTDEMVEALYPFALKAQEQGQVVLVHSTDVIAPLNEKGIKDVRQSDYRTVTENPQYECDCRAVILVTYSGGRVTKCCIVPEHFKAWKSVQDTAKKALAKEAEAKIEKARRSAAKAMSANAGGVSMEGQRVALYVILTRERGSGYYGGSDKSTAFVKRHGGLVDENGKDQGKSEASPEQVWTTITGLSDADLGKEFGGIVAAMLFPNVFGQDGAWVASKDAHVRQFFVDQFDVDQEVVWGKATPPQKATVEDEGDEHPELEEPIADEGADGVEEVVE